MRISDWSSDVCSSDLIDQGVFHNDVIAVGNGEVLFYHEDAFLETERMLAELSSKLAKVGGKFQSVCVPRSAVTVDDAVRSYLFNSQLLSRPDGSMLLIVPQECRGNERVWQYLQGLRSEARRVGKECGNTC